MAEEQALTADEFDTWLTPREALTLLEPQFPDYAAHAWISKRLRSGQIRAAASCLHVPPNPAEIAIKPIPTAVWDELDDGVPTDPLWIDGDLAVSLPGFVGMAHIVYNYLGVRFEPSAIHALLPKPAPARSGSYHPPPQPLSGETLAASEVAARARDAPQTAMPAQESDSPPKGKPLSEALLRDWYQLYLSAYTEAERTESLAIRSVAGMFPGRSATRDRVRKLIQGSGEARSRGRPAQKKADPAN